MGTGAPYREPCDGWYRRKYVGGCFQHWRLSEAHVPKYDNTTAVANWNCGPGRPASPATINPYERFASGSNCSGGGDPAPGDADWCDTEHTKPPCGQWSRSEFAEACAGGEIRLDVNCYAAAAGESGDVALCQKVGFKAVQARKTWHGRYGFTSNDPDGCVLDETGLQISESPDQTRYLVLAVSLVGTCNFDPAHAGNTWAEHQLNWARTYTVDKHTGIITESGKSDSFVMGDHGEGAPEGGYSMPFATNFLAMVINCGLLGGSGQYASNWNAALPVVNILLESNLTARSITATSATFTITTPNLTSTWYIDVDFTATLSSPYYGSRAAAEAVSADPDESLEGEVHALLAEWDLTNDKIYPWRRDKYTTVNPLVSYDELQSAASPDGHTTDWDAAAWTDPNAGLYSGDVLGKPFTAGYPEARLTGQNQTETKIGQGSGTFTLAQLGPTLNSINRYVWDVGLGAYSETPACTPVLGTDYNFTVDEYGVGTVEIVSWPTGCLGDQTGGDHPDKLEVNYDFDWALGGHFDFRHVDDNAVDTYGAWSGGSGSLDPTNACQPRNATQWTNTTQSDFPHGAWMVMKAGTWQLWGQKYAEIKLPWKSQNWFGPSGADRDLAEWPDAWPIEGDRGCTFTDMGGGTVRVTVSAAMLWLRVADHVDFTDADGVPTVADVHVTAVDGTGNGSGPGAWFEFSGSAPGASSVRVKSHDAPGYWWYDTDGKGGYSYITHTLDYRTAYLWELENPGETYAWTPVSATNACLSFNRCWPAVMCFSPNYDEDDPECIDRFEHGTTYGFGAFTPDGTYGARWQGAFKQIMQDYWYVSGYSPYSKYVECQEARPAAWIVGDAYVPTYSLGAVTYLAGADLGVAGQPADEFAPWAMWLDMQHLICVHANTIYRNVLGAWMCGAEP